MTGLFDDSFDRDGLRDRLRTLSDQGIYIGGSSWKYEGWLDQIYDRQNYLYRGKFSRKAFQETSLREYGATFPTVMGDFAFYQFPTEAYWQQLFRQVPAHFRFGFKVPEDLTCKVFPSHPRYGPKGGMTNPLFLDDRMFWESFARPLMPYRANVGVLVFEFGAFARTTFPRVETFLEMLDPFLGNLPSDFRYAVEIRNSEFLTPRYFDCLRKHNVAHTFNAWTRMPEIPEQVALAGSITADFLVTRALLRQGRTFEDAVQRFQPYREVQEVNASARKGLREIISVAKREKRTAFVFVNNRLEGNSPGTIVAITED